MLFVIKHLKGFIVMYAVRISAILFFSFGVLSAHASDRLYKDIDYLIPERPKAEVSYFPVTIDQNNGWLVNPRDGISYKNYFSLEKKTCEGNPYEIQECITAHFRSKFASADKEVCRALIEDTKPGTPVNWDHPNVTDGGYEKCDLYVGGLDTPASEYDGFVNAHLDRLHAVYTIKYYSSSSKEWKTLSGDRQVYKFDPRWFFGIPTGIIFNDVTGLKIHCPPESNSQFTLFDNMNVPDAAREMGAFNDVEPSESWYDIGYCAPAESYIYDLENIETPLNDFIIELTGENGQKYQSLITKQLTDEFHQRYSLCGTEFMTCHTVPVPNREVSNSYGGRDVEFKYVVDSLDFAHIWRNDNVSGDISEAIYFVVDSLLNLNPSFEWLFEINNHENSPLPETIFALYPNLTEKLFDQPSLVESFGDKVCYPVTEEFVEAFKGTNWLEYACSDETEQCPLENTGPACLNGNPINIRNGTKLESVTDFNATGNSLLKLARQYSSANKRWQFNKYTQQLLIDNDYVKLTGRKQNNLLFSCSTENRTCNRKALVGQTTNISNYQVYKGTDGYQLTLPSGAIENYNSTGRLISTVSAQGEQISYSYGENSITTTDEFGQSITLTTEDHKVISAVTPIGNFAYSYDEFDRLTTVTQPDNSTIQYRYDEAGFSVVQYYSSTEHTCSGDDYLTDVDCKALVKNLGLLTGKIDEKGQRVASWHYDEQQRAYKSEHGTGIDTTEIHFVSEQGERAEDNAGNPNTLQQVRDSISPLGLKTRTTFRAPHGQRAEKIETFDAEDNLVSTEHYSYDNNGYESEYVDIDGNITRYVHDSLGRETSRIEYADTENARTITTSYQGNTNKPIVITSPETRVNMSYVNHNTGLLVATQTITDLSTNELRLTSYSYDSKGQLTSVDGPLTDVNDITTYEYNAQGLRTKTTNALGHSTEVTSFNAYGKPLSVTDENGILTAYSYDLMGRVTQVARAGTIQQFEYDVNGDLLKSTPANGAHISYEYDSARRLIATEDLLGNRIEYTLDAAGNQLAIQVKDESGALTLAQQQIFDEFSRLTTTINGTNDTSQIDYLTNGSVNSATDALNNTSTNSYDALQRLKAIHDPEGGKTEFGYDNAGRTTSVTDATGKTTQYTYNGFGELVQQISPDTGTTSYSYDKAGNLASETDARGITVSYQYDALNRVTDITYPDSSENITFSFDDAASGNKGVGRLTSVNQASSNYEYSYNQLGQMLSEQYSIGEQSYGLNYHYDAAGQQTGMNYPSGAKVNYVLDSQGQIAAITYQAPGVSETQNILTNATYLPFGPVASFTFGNALTNSYTYDLNYRLTAHQLTDLKNKTLKYSATGNIEAITDSIAGANSFTFGYDKLSRLLSASNGSLAGELGNISFTYDGIGNRLTKTNGPVNQSYSYIENTHHLEKVTVEGAAVTPTTAGTYYDARRLASIANAQYQYNYRQLRVAKTMTDGEVKGIHYHYDQNGLLIAESTAEGKWLKEYIYFNGQLVAMVDVDLAGGHTLYMVHTDHLGTPNQITDMSGKLVWQAEYSPFGLATIQSDIDGDGQHIELNIRFPGQYYDKESGLHYNWHRYYDPAIGRYITSDPLGLAAGINTYGYVEQNPINYIDFMGLDKWDYDGIGNTNVCSYYDELAKENPDCPYFTEAAQICRGMNVTVSFVSNSAISYSWLTDRTNASQSEIYDSVRNKLVFYDKQARNAGKIDAYGCTCGDTIDFYHDQAFEESGLLPLFYGGNLWPQNTYPNPVPYDSRGEDKVDDYANQ